MSGIIEGYNYDIFISYRQKDNKGDRWVSEFVEALKAELESTFKEEVSVYFDINPHDGLLETHDVDASLKDKLKCLIFIPIISRTYCDPMSFAWKHEFLAFMEQASFDSTGLRIRLPYGNVASRVLPVRIHELDQADVKLCESAMGGPLRAIDFIYKSSGVNRPLRINEDNPRENLNHTFYRDQINKVANAIKEIIDGLKGTVTEKAPIENIKQNPGVEPQRRHITKIPTFLKLAIPLAALAIIIILVFSRPEIVVSGSRIAMIPLVVTGDENLELLAGTFGETFNDRMMQIGLTPVPRISMLQYASTEKEIKDISRELSARYIVSGNIKLEAGKTVIWLELISGRANKSLWSERYFTESEMIPAVTIEIVRKIAAKLRMKLSPEVLALLEEDLTEDATANLNYISANALINNATFFESYGAGEASTDLLRAIESYNRALSHDSLFAEAYARRSLALSWGIYLGYLSSSYVPLCRNDAQRSLELKKNLPEGHIAMGFYYYYCHPNESLKALEHFATASELMPGDYHPEYYMALVHRRDGDWEESQNLMRKVISSTPSEALFLTNIGISYEYMHDYDSAIMFHQRAIAIMPSWSDAHLNKAFSILLRDGKTAKAWPSLNAGYNGSSKVASEYRSYFLMLDGKYRDALAEIRSSAADQQDKYLQLATVYNRINESDSARIYYDSTIFFQKQFVGMPDNLPHIQMNLAQAYAGKGDYQRSIQEAGKALEQINRAGTSMMKSEYKQRYASILIMTDEHDEAIRLIDDLLTNPSLVSVKLIEHDITYDQLRSNPEFRAMMKKHSKK
jgi:TolB-like protein